MDPIVATAEPGRVLVIELAFSPSKRSWLRLNLGLQSAAGCFDNKGLEGMAVIALDPSNQPHDSSPRNSYHSDSLAGDVGLVWTTFQSSLLQDGQMEGEKCRGDFVRGTAFNRPGQRVSEIAYPLSDRKSGISELLAVNEHRLLVLERDGEDGEKARVKRIYLADTRTAFDVSNVRSLRDRAMQSEGKVSSPTPVSRPLLIDLPQWEDDLGEAARAEKPEGLTWGKPLADGRRTLWVC